MDSPPETPITSLLHRMQTGDCDAEEELAVGVYPELRRQARRLFASEQGTKTLQPTALVHEAYMRLIGTDSQSWKNRQHFFAVASIVMRRILVDYARKRRSAKRGGNAPATVLVEESMALNEVQLDVVLAVDQALRRLEQVDHRQARIVELRFFGGLTENEIGQVLNISERTVKRDWRMAKAWLQGSFSAYAESART